MRVRITPSAFCAVLLLACVPALGQQAGSIRGAVSDKDFDIAIGNVLITIAETGQKATTSDQGSYVLAQVKPGTYTVVFSKDGYVRQVKADVRVTPGQLVDIDVALAGEFTDLDEFVVEDNIQFGTNTEAGLLKLRLDSPALLDSVSSDLISRAGASDAAGALRLVAGASVQDGKYAVVRGLPDRYVSSQMNGVRLPTADENKRAVQLDQFPSAVIDSIQVSKTFTPDQQADASGGAVNVKLKGIPDDPFFFRVSSQVGRNSQASGRKDFLSYRGGGLNFFGDDGGKRGIQNDNLGANWTGAVGVSPTDAPQDYKWSVATGGKHDFGDGVKLGGSASFFYDRYSSFYDNGIDDSWWVTTPGGPMVPKSIQGTPESGEFKTRLFDVTQSKQAVRWGALGTVGAEIEDHAINLTWLHTRTAEDSTTLAEDTRGKKYFFQGYNPSDPTTPGHDEAFAAPYVRLETLDYQERTTDTLQLNGHHKLPIDNFGIPDVIRFHQPEIDWTVAYSSSQLHEPDKRQFGGVWFPQREPFPGFIIPARWIAFQPAESFTLGNLQRIFKDIREDSDEYAINLKLPFERWGGEQGWFKFGFFDDQATRKFTQNSFSNFNDSASSFNGEYSTFWSSVFPSENHPITASLFDVNYDGTQSLRAWYGMGDIPLTADLKLIGGVRLESTEIGIVNHPESLATWFPPGSLAPTILNPGDADVSFTQDDVLPSIALEYKPIKELTLRGAYNETVARQTFKELSPIIQQEFLGGPIFIGNPNLQMSAVKNYDLRADWSPYEGGLVSGSWFRKDIRNPIEFVQQIASFDFTTPVNYPKGTLSGYEIEIRQKMGQFWEPLEGFTLGANATFISSKVILPADEAASFNQPGIQAPIYSRDMTNAPAHLYNINATYDFADTGTQVGLFYTVQGDTLIAGAGDANGNFVPSLYSKEFGTLNLSVNQKLGDHFKLQFQAKNLLNPEIETVYRSKYIGSDVLHTSFTRGVDFTLSLSCEFTF